MLTKKKIRTLIMSNDESRKDRKDDHEAEQTKERWRKKKEREEERNSDRRGRYRKVTAQLQAALKWFVG